mmetsp:Transcript_4166/g.6632  ORF Transcript_4166/g.6632 Transcript_4166/m.6632 type:complete len:174 (+) Transcript_4166:616-1137(+)
MAATVSLRVIFCDLQMALTKNMLHICCISNTAAKPKKKPPVICSSFMNVEQKVVYMIMRRIRLLNVENGILLRVDDDMMLEYFAICPRASGRTTVTKSFEKIDAIGTLADPPVTFITSRGVTITPKKAPIVPLTNPQVRQRTTSLFNKTYQYHDSRASLFYIWRQLRCPLWPS